MNPSIPWATIDKMFKDNPNFIVKHHIESYNNFFSNGIQEIFRDRNPIHFFKEIDKETQLYKYECEIYLGGINSDKIYYGKPIIYDDNINDAAREHYMYPNEARLRNMTYGFTIHYDIDVKFKILIDKEDGTTGKNKFNVHEKIITIDKVYFGRFPIMLQSNLCLLNGLSPEARYNMGECRNDPGGYFIIDGNEKSIVSQEGRANNTLYILKDINDLYSYSAEIKSVSEDASKPVRTLAIRMVREQPSLTNNQIVVNIPQVRKAIPLFIVMRALGIISDKDIITHCLLDLDSYENYIDLFIPSVHDAGNIFTQKAALSYIASLTKGKTLNHVLEILMNYFLPHIGELNFKAKALYLGYIVKRLLNVYTGLEKPTDRDSFKFKRLEVSGNLLYSLFKEYYKLQQDNIYLKIDKEYFYKKNQTSYQNLDFINLIHKNVELFFNDRLVEIGFKNAFKGNWGSTAHTKRPGVAQETNRLSFWGFLAQLRKTNLHISADGAKVVGPRLLHSTQHGLLCPIHSPDGGNVGLHNHMALAAIVTPGCSGRPYIKYLRKLEDQGIKLLEECSLEYLSNSTKIFLNGGWIGCTHNPLRIINIMKLHRRNGMIDIYTSVSFNIKRNEIIIFTDAGRLMRPLFFMMEGMISYERDKVLAAYENNSISWTNIIKGFNTPKDALEESCKIVITSASVEKLIENASVVEYIDTEEAESALLAHSNLKREELIPNKITHLEIHPSLALSMMANQVIFPENNPYPRNAFSCGQSKQGVSLYNSNFNNRLDKSAFVLNSGQIPLTKSRYLNYVTQEEHPYGENAIVAIMCYSGYNVEDAVIFNEASLKRGIFRTTYYNTYKAHETTEKVANFKVDTKFMSVIDENVLGVKAGYNYQNLDPVSGLVKEGTVVTENSIIMGMGTNSIDNPDIYVDNSVKAKKGQVGVVDKAFMTEGEEGKRIAKVRIRGERIPAIGDKFCSRAGQKGTIGLIMREQDMPCTEDGIRPDIIVNPHAMPSRMTIGHLVETITSKVGCIYGQYGDCTAFLNKGSKHKELGKMLTKEGFHSSGTQYLYNGMTGEQMETEIYFGPTYYLRLKHMPKDKINYRARGPRTVLTRQTVQGRANNGGLRIGEMDRDCLIAHGLSKFINESMMVRGDQYYMAVCNKTGCIAVYNESKNLFLSPMADGPVKYVTNLDNNLNVINISKYGRDFSIVKVPYAFKLLLQELQTMNIQMRIITSDNVDNLLSLTEGDDIRRLTGLTNLEQVMNDINQTLDKEKDPLLIKEKTPEEISFNEEIEFMEKQPTPVIDPKNQMSIYEQYPEPDLPVGTQLDAQLYQPSEFTYFKDGTFVKVKNEPNSAIYKVIDFDDETMDYILEAQTGPYKGKYRDESDLNLVEYELKPGDLDSQPLTPDYPPRSPLGVDSPEAAEAPSPLPREWSPVFDPNTPPEITIETETANKMQEEKAAIVDDILDELGSAEDDGDDKADDILKTVTTINKTDTKGLNKLSAIEEEKKDNDEEEENSDVKEIK